MPKRNLKKEPKKKEISKPKKVVFDKGKKLKVKNSTNFGKSFVYRTFFKKIKNSIQNSKVILILLILILLILIIFPVFRIYTFNSNVKASYVSLGEVKGLGCLSYTKKNFTSTLRIGVMGKKLNLAKIHIVSENRLLSIDVINTEFQIDKNGTVGSISKYYEILSTYLSEEKFFEALKKFIFGQTGIQVNNVILEKETSSIDKFTNAYNSNYLSKAISSKKLESKIYGDYCQNQFGIFLRDYTNYNKITNLNYTKEIKIRNYLNTSQIKKEQVRIEIINETGIPSHGSFMRQVLENYGFNVVKLESSSKRSQINRIQTENDSLVASETIARVREIFDVKSENIKTEANLYSDLTIVLGTESLF